MSVFVLGAGMTPFTRRLGRTPEDLATEAIMAAVLQSGIDRSLIDIAYVGSLYEPPGLGQRILKDIGITGIPISNLENACSTGTDALIHAVRAVATGEARVALAVGVDTPTRIAATGILPLTPGDPSLEMGVTAPSVYALRAQRYLENTGSTAADIASVAVKSRQHAEHNAVATFRDRVTVDEVLASPMIAHPLTRLQCCPVSDGAGAVLVGRIEHGTPLARVDGWALRSGTMQDEAKSVDAISSRTATAAYEMAGISPSDIDLIEVHDAFTIGELLAMESLGICPKGEAARYVSAGRATIGGGGVAVNPSGGLLARGHPPGATGLAQIVEASLQLTGEAGPRQIEDARVAVCHTRGGGSFDLDANACGVIVLTSAGNTGAQQ